MAKESNMQGNDKSGEKGPNRYGNNHCAKVEETEGGG